MKFIKAGLCSKGIQTISALFSRLKKADKIATILFSGHPETVLLRQNTKNGKKKK